MPASKSLNKGLPRLDCLVVVEGKTDIARLGLLFDADFVATNGSAVDRQTIRDITFLARQRKVVIFTDNDHAGEKIRRFLHDGLPGAADAFITSSWGKMGQVALASDQEIKNALAAVRTTAAFAPGIHFAEYASLMVSAAQRRHLCAYFRISQCNNKQFFKRMHAAGQNAESLREILLNAGV